MANEINREYKSTLFNYMFSQKEFALELYNALNNSNYTNPDDVKITTLMNVLFINVYNDVSFMIDSTLQLFEHQSTYNLNIPLRSLIYLSNTYEKWVKENEYNIYGTALIELPTPNCMVFYNGKKSVPDSHIMKLSDAFINKNYKGSLELEVQMLNINFSHNRDLLNKCKSLYGYSLYISKFREYNEIEQISRQEAAIKALDYCIEQNVMADFFRERRNEVVNMILEEYNVERVENDMAKMQQTIDRQKEKLADKDIELADKDKELADKDIELADKDKELADKDKELADKDRELANKDIEITRLKAALEAKNN